MSRFIYTTSQKLAALRRELELRIRLYPKRVSERKLTRDKAEYEVNIIRAMIDDYEDKSYGDDARRIQRS
jgi:predicted DNA-binding protein